MRDIEEYTAARISRTVPRPSKEDVSVSSFVQEQRKKKEAIDRLRQLDKKSLQSLNSPLPTPGKAPARIPPPVLQRAPAPPAVRTSSPDISLASLTMGKKSEGSEMPSTPASSPPPSPSQPLNLFDMTKLKQDSDSSSSTARPAAKKTPAKRVVRQQVPLSTRDDDDDDDDDNLMRSGAPGLTVADALKQQRKSGGGSGSGGKKNISADDKAKQWGIDMSKFQ